MAFRMIESGAQNTDLVWPNSSLPRVITRSGGEAGPPPQGGPTPIVPAPLPLISGWEAMFQSYSARIPTFDNVTIVDFPPSNLTDVVTKRYVDESISSIIGGGGALTAVIHDDSLAGDGTAALPLMVAKVDGGTFV